MDILTTLVTLLVGLVLGALIGLLWARSRPQDTGLATALEARERRESTDQALVRDSLMRLHDQLRDIDQTRASWQGQLSQQVTDMRLTAESLRRETSSLATALRKPQVRGRWGEMHLRRAVELAGLVDHCDFTEQVRLADGVLRPDLVVRLAGGRSVVVDAKVPLDAFLDATGAEDDEERDAHLHRHVGQLRRHVDQLAAKAYWRSLEETPEFVVMFVPAEAFLAAALETRGDLLEYAATRHVVLATPTTLIALLRTVAHGWSHETLAGQAAEVQRLGRELHERLGTLGGHLDKVGRSLGAAVASYNSAVGSLEGRVLVTARRFGEMGVTQDELPSPRQVEQAPRSLSAPELEQSGTQAHGTGADAEPEPGGGIARDLDALGDVARPGRVETLFDGSFGLDRPAPRTDEEDGRARGA